MPKLTKRGRGKSLESIGFYTLSDNRAKNITPNSSIQRGELILTDRCNLNCVYCRGIKKEFRGDMELSYAESVLDEWIKEGLKNVRFSGGEPTLYPHLDKLVWKCNQSGVKRIAVSTNGTQDLRYYKDLIFLGVNDFSISLDSGCCAVNKVMSGGNKDVWSKASEAIKYLSKHCYVTVGVVFNEINYSQAKETVEYIDSLSPADIRILSSAQFNQALTTLKELPNRLLKKYPILNYRITNFRKGRNVRGIKATDCNKCYLVLDDLAVVNKYQYPCIIYLREQGVPISVMDGNFRKERLKWFNKHNTHLDNICKNNCLDVCVDFNNKVQEIPITERKK